MLYSGLLLMESSWYFVFMPLMLCYRSCFRLCICILCLSWLLCCIDFNWWSVELNSLFLYIDSLLLYNSDTCQTRNPKVIYVEAVLPKCYTMPPNSPKNLPTPMGESESPSNTSFIGPTQLTNPNGISIESASFAQYVVITSGHTDWRN